MPSKSATPQRRFGTVIRAERLRQKFTQSAFLREFRELSQQTTRGCIVLERPDLLKTLVEKHHAKAVNI